MKNTYLLLIIFLVSFLQLSAQHKTIKWGKVDPADLSMTVYPGDSEADRGRRHTPDRQGGPVRQQPVHQPDRDRPRRSSHPDPGYLPATGRGQAGDPGRQNLQEGDAVLPARISQVHLRQCRVPDLVHGQSPRPADHPDRVR